MESRQAIQKKIRESLKKIDEYQEDISKKTIPGKQGNIDAACLLIQIEVNKALSILDSNF